MWCGTLRVPACRCTVGFYRTREDRMRYDASDEEEPQFSPSRIPITVRSASCPVAASWRASESLMHFHVSLLQHGDLIKLSATASETQSSPPIVAVKEKRLFRNLQKCDRSVQDYFSRGNVIFALTRYGIEHFRRARRGCGIASTTRAGRVRRLDRRGSAASPSSGSRLTIDLKCIRGIG